MEPSVVHGTVVVSVCTTRVVIVDGVAVTEAAATEVEAVSEACEEGLDVLDVVLRVLNVLVLDVLDVPGVLDVVAVVALDVLDVLDVVDVAVLVLVLDVLVVVTDLEDVEPDVLEPSLAATELGTPITHVRPRQEVLYGGDAGSEADALEAWVDEVVSALAPVGNDVVELALDLRVLEVRVVHVVLDEVLVGLDVVVLEVLDVVDVVDVMVLEVLEVLEVLDVVIMAVLDVVGVDVHVVDVGDGFAVEIPMVVLNSGQYVTYTERYSSYVTTTSTIVTAESVHCWSAHEVMVTEV